jgi:putative ABC transport system ATP-binding protein
MSQLAVEVMGVTKVYRSGGVETAALRGVDLTVEVGGFVALAGPSGSGKTTLLNLIGCLDRPTGGQIKVGGQVTTGLSANRRADFRAQSIGFVFQSLNLIPVLTVLENVELPLLLHGVPAAERRRRATGLVAAVGLAGKTRRRPSELSGGEQQRVAVARSLVTRPAVVLADEPTASLDSATGVAIIEVMRQLNREYGATFLFATHDPIVVERVDRVVRLRDGQVV